MFHSHALSRPPPRRSFRPATPPPIRNPSSGGKRSPAPWIPGRKSAPKFRPPKRTAARPASPPGRPPRGCGPCGTAAPFSRFPDSRVGFPCPGRPEPGFRPDTGPPETPRAACSRSPKGDRRRPGNGSTASAPDRTPGSAFRRKKPPGRRRRKPPKRSQEKPAGPVGRIEFREKLPESARNRSKIPADPKNRSKARRTGRGAESRGARFRESTSGDRPGGATHPENRQGASAGTRPFRGAGRNGRGCGTCPLLGRQIRAISRLWATTGRLDWRAGSPIR
jgi:hypothetical protein